MEMSVDKKDITKKIAGFVRDHEEIIFAYIFGSFIEDEVFNDVDVAIYVNEDDIPAKGIFYEIELSKHLEEIIEIPVDMVKLNKSSDSILYRASKGLLIKNSDDNKRINFLTMHWKKYWDFKSKIREHMVEMKRGSR